MFFIFVKVYIVLHFLGDYETRVIEPAEFNNESNVGIITAHMSGKYDEGLKKGSFVVASAHDERPYAARIFDICYTEETAMEAASEARDESKVNLW